MARNQTCLTEHQVCHTPTRTSRRRDYILIDVSFYDHKSYTSAPCVINVNSLRSVIPQSQWKPVYTGYRSRYVWFSRQNRWIIGIFIVLLIFHNAIRDGLENKFHFRTFTVSVTMKFVYSIEHFFATASIMKYDIVHRRILLLPKAHARCPMHIQGDLFECQITLDISRKKKMSDVFDFCWQSKIQAAVKCFIALIYGIFNVGRCLKTVCE